MYKVFCDGFLIYHSKLENLKIFNPSIELELNKTGSFEFAIYSDHPYYNQIQKLKSIVTVYQDDYPIFSGRVLDDEIGWYNEKHVVCEGDLAFLLDSVLRPFSFTGTVAEFVAYVIGLHNAQVDENKRFTVGSVTVSGDITYDATEYLTTKEMLEKVLLEPYNGYFVTRFENGVRYIDYLADINLLSPQKIQFGKNLMDLKRIRKGTDIATVIIPLGAKIEGSEARLTIESVNGGVDFIQDDDAIAQFGTIVKSVVFDDITDAETLKQKGQAQLAESVNQWETIELTAADLATVDSNFSSFHLGTQVDVISNPHGINQRFIVSKLSIKLLDPVANKLTLGKVVQAFSTAVQGISDTQNIILQEIGKSVKTASDAVLNIDQNLSSTVQVSEDNIKAAVSETYSLKDETEALVSSVSTELTVTKESFEIEFQRFNADIQAVSKGVDVEFEEIRKYIRFEDGKVYIGEVGNELELQIANDRISFLQDGAEVAYFSNRKLFVTDTQILHSLQLGNFAFMPRANGNLSFKRTN